MVDGACTKGYAKGFVETTELQSDGYPKYRRREASPCVPKGSNMIDARDVVPYNPYLSKKLKCHLNVEYCGTIRAVKYLYKYTYKGHDRAMLEFEQDEVKQFLDARYVGPPEAAWRIFSFPMHKKSHHIERLAVHVPNMETVCYAEGGEREAAQERKASTLMAWFELNTAEPDGEDPPVKNLLYAEIPEHFTWDQKNRKWRRRRSEAAKAKVIGRMYTASPNEEDRFYLYLLLLHRRGIKSFEDLVTVETSDGNWETFTTEVINEKGDPETIFEFHRAAKALGLTAVDNEYYEIMRDAAQHKTGFDNSSGTSYFIVNEVTMKDLFSMLVTKICPRIIDIASENTMTLSWRKL